VGLVLGDQPARIDMNQVQNRKDKIVTIITRGVEFLFKKNNITWIRGSARLAGPGTVEVTGDEKQTLTAKEVVIATGRTRAACPASSWTAHASSRATRPSRCEPCRRRS